AFRRRSMMKATLLPSVKYSRTLDASIFRADDNSSTSQVSIRKGFIGRCGFSECEIPVSCLRQESLGDGSLQPYVYRRCRLKEIEPGVLEFQLSVVINVARGHKKMMKGRREFAPQFL